MSAKCTECECKCNDYGDNDDDDDNGGDHDHEDHDSDNGDDAGVDDGEIERGGWEIYRCEVDTKLKRLKLYCIIYYIQRWMERDTFIEI